MRLRIVELREAAGLTQEQLAERSGLSRGYIAQIEAGGKNPTLDKLAALARGLGVPMRELFPPAHGSNSGPLRIEPSEAPSLVPHVNEYRIRGDEGLPMGYPSGAILLVDLNAAPQDGDAVLYQQIDRDTGERADHVGRYLRGAIMGSRFMVDPNAWSEAPTDDVAVRGVILGAIYRSHKPAA